MDKRKDIQADLTQRSNDEAYWDERWETMQTAWDIGYASLAITEYMAQYPDKQAAILIPGCGNAYEAAWLAGNGFTNITLIDIAPTVVASLEKKFAGIASIRVLCGDFFEHQGNYNLMIEQTFFCAISPANRARYAAKTASLLNEGGKLIGLLFAKNFEHQGPPFGGDFAEYRAIFEPHFIVNNMNECYNSIPSRDKCELFINLIKKTKA